MLHYPPPSAQTCSKQGAIHTQTTNNQITNRYITQGQHAQHTRLQGMSSQLSITVQINQSNFASRLTEVSPGSSCRRTCKHCTSPPEVVLVSPARSAGSTDPSLSCNGLLGELSQKVMRAALRVSETAGGHGQPPITLADVPCNAVTNCCNTWTFDSISPASCCNCNAAERVFSLPMCSTHYSGLRLSNRADSGAPTYSSKRGS